MSAAGSAISTWGRRYGAPVLLAAVAVVVYCFPRAAQRLEYDRGALEAGEVWRLVSGHWTHGSLDHLAWDVVLFAVLGCALLRLSPRVFWWSVVGSALAISLALFALEPRLATYRGLSGVDSALFAALATVVWLGDRRRAARWLGAAALFLLAGKIVFELATGVTLFAADVAGLEVVPLAHFVGLGAGLVAALGPWAAGGAAGGRETPKNQRHCACPKAL